MIDRHIDSLFIESSRLRMEYDTQMSVMMSGAMSVMGLFSTNIKSQ